MNATLIRTQTGNEGTFGYLVMDGFTCCSLELPWRENMVNFSCIPCGAYRCSMVRSNRFGESYKVHDVPGRTDILFHPGNVAGDEDFGFRTNVRGCILLAQRRGFFGEQHGIMGSRLAIREFHQHAGGQDLDLLILDRYHERSHNGIRRA